MSISYAQVRTFLRGREGEFPMFFAGFLTVAMLCSARFWLEFVWGLTPLSYEFIILMGLIFMELMILVFTTHWWNKFSGTGPLNLVQNIFIIPIGLVVTFGILPYLAAGVVLSLIFYDLRFVMVRYEAILYCFMIGAPVNRVGSIYGKERRILFPKHWSFIDIIMFAAMYSGRRWCALSKLKMIIFIPFTPFLLLQGIMLRRGKKKMATRESFAAAKKKMAKHLEELDEDLLLYAEGTRSWDIRPFQSILAHTAMETKTLLTPIAIKPKQPYICWFGFKTQPPVNAVIGYDIDPAGFTEAQKLTDHAHTVLKRMWEKK